MSSTSVSALAIEQFSQLQNLAETIFQRVQLSMRKSKYQPRLRKLSQRYFSIELFEGERRRGALLIKVVWQSREGQPLPANVYVSAMASAGRGGFVEWPLTGKGRYLFNEDQFSGRTVQQQHAIRLRDASEQSIDLLVKKITNCIDGCALPIVEESIGSHQNCDSCANQLYCLSYSAKTQEE